MTLNVERFHSLRERRRDGKTLVIYAACDYANVKREKVNHERKEACAAFYNEQSLSVTWEHLLVPASSRPS